MGRQVAIASAGFSEHASKRSDVSMAELVSEAVEDCLKNAPSIGIEDIDAFVNGNMPAFEGANIPELWMTDWMGARNKPLLRVTTGGTTGGTVAIAGYYTVTAGVPNVDTVLAVAFEHQSIGDTSVGLASVAYGEISILNTMGIPYDQLSRLLSAGAAIGVAAYQATNYMRKTHITEEDLARVVVQNRRNAAKTWWTHLKMPNLTIEEVIDTPYISFPLRYGMVCPASDGACAMLFTTEEKAKDMCDIPVYVNGVASVANETAVLGYDGSGTGQIDPSDQLGAMKSSDLAYSQAGISFPRKEIDYAEVYSPFPNQELMWVEKLGLFEETTAPRMYESGITALNGELPINCSGGVNATNAIGASAMERPAEAALQIMGKASNQVPKTVHTSIGHGWGGSLNLCTMMVMSDEPQRKWR
ncbi:MAG: acetyl-CoA acetyltransferase [Promethearchaeota archaeon Loki_b31]|nr:MAG: acetyl-CoA acetyltransferase [Candidatus Lokiarchaeota archaeon Loki_b31]